MRITEDKIREQVRKELAESRKNLIRKIIREELMKEAKNEELIKTVPMDAQKMLNEKIPFTVVGFRENEVKVSNNWDKLNSYRIVVNTFINADVSPEVMNNISKAVFPYIEEMGVKKQNEKFQVLKTKTQEFGVSDIGQTITLYLPQGIEVVYR